MQPRGCVRTAAEACVVCRIRLALLAEASEHAILLDRRLVELLAQRLPGKHSHECC